MKPTLLTICAIFLVTGLAATPALAACPEDIDAFAREYDETLRSAQAGEALTASEQAQLFGLKTAAEKLHQAGKADMCAEIIARARLTLESAVAPQVIRPDEIVGRKVANAAGESLGEIEDVMLDPVSGRIAYVVVEHGGVLGIGDDLFAVPWRAMTFTPAAPGDEAAVILDIPEERLEDAPRFDRKDESPLERREWVTAVHNYYGVEPYWQDDVRSALLEYGGAAPAPQPTEANPDAGAAAPTEPGAEQAAVPEGAGSPPAALLTPGAPPSDASGAPVEESVEGEAAAVPSDDFGMLAERMDKLEQRVTELTQTGMSEVEKSIESLQDKVQQLSEEGVGDEMRQKLAGIEAKLTALAGGAAADAALGEASEDGAPAAAAQGEAGQQPGQPGTQSGPPNPQAEDGKQAAAPEADQPSQGQPPAQEPAGQQKQGDKAATEQDTAAAAPPAKTDATGDGTAEDAAGQSCEKQLTQLDEDLKQAEQRGIAISDVRSDYDEARAMLDNNSEALCRAAIKRARDELVGLGFKPTEVN